MRFTPPAPNLGTSEAIYFRDPDGRSGDILEPAEARVANEHQMGRSYRSTSHLILMACWPRDEIDVNPHPFDRDWFSLAASLQTIPTWSFVGARQRYPLSGEGTGFSHGLYGAHCRVKAVHDRLKGEWR